jgi:hypothetical protein
MNGKPLVLDSPMFEPVDFHSASARTSAESCDDEVLVSMVAEDSKNG